MNNFIGKSYLSDPSICDRLIEWYKENEASHYNGLVSVSAGKELSKHLGKKSTDFTFNATSVLNDNAYNGKGVLTDYLSELQAALEEYILVYPFCNTGLPFYTDKINIQYYKPYEGFKVFHYERSSAANFDRHLVFMTYLNSVEDGGTEFLYQKEITNAVKGRTLIFPADWTHTHRGIISPSMEKYVITGWYVFNKK